MKISIKLGQDLRDRFDLADHRGDPAYGSYDQCAEIWFDRLETFQPAPESGAYSF